MILIGNRQPFCFLCKFEKKGKKKVLGKIFICQAHEKMFKMPFQKRIKGFDPRKLEFWDFGDHFVFMQIRRSRRKNLFWYPPWLDSAHPN